MHFILLTYEKTTKQLQKFQNYIYEIGQEPLDSRLYACNTESPIRTLLYIFASRY